MKYYCTGNPIPLIEQSYSVNFFKSPVITPTIKKAAITQEKMKTAFEESDTLLLFKTLADAKGIRTIIADPVNVEPNVITDAQAGIHLLSDYAIYEIEVDDNNKMNFTKLIAIPFDDMQALLYKQARWMKAFSSDNISMLFNIEICSANKNTLNPTLLASHYFSPSDGKEIIEQENTTSCRIL